jgi:esterase
MSQDLFTETKGDPKNPAVLCIHGLLGVSRNLWRLTEGIAKAGYFVIAYDQRGHGRSPWASNPDEQYALPSLAADAIGVLGQFGIAQAHFVGHSMGGRVALAASILAPDQIKSLCLLDVGHRITPQAMEEIHHIIDPLPLEGFKSKDEAMAFLQSHYKEAIAQFLFSNLRSSSSSGAPLKWVFDLAGMRRFLQAGLQLDQSQALKQLQCPVKLLRGEKSRYVTAGDEAAMVALQPALDCVTIPGAGHWLHVDNLQSTLHEVLQFFIRQS